MPFIQSIVWVTMCRTVRYMEIGSFKFIPSVIKKLDEHLNQYLISGSNSQGVIIKECVMCIIHIITPFTLLYSWSDDYLRALNILFILLLGGVVFFGGSTKDASISSGLIVLSLFS